MDNKFLNSKETIGGYSLRNLTIEGATIFGDWQDPEQLKWTPGGWDAKSGKLLKFGGTSSNYDLVAPGEMNAEDKAQATIKGAYSDKDKNYPFGE